jgi:hypothetical protein
VIYCNHNHKPYRTLTLFTIETQTTVINVWTTFNCHQKKDLDGLTEPKTLAEKCARAAQQQQPLRNHLLSLLPSHSAGHSLQLLLPSASNSLPAYVHQPTASAASNSYAHHVHAPYPLCLPGNGSLSMPPLGSNAASFSHAKHSPMKGLQGQYLLHSNLPSTSAPHLQSAPNSQKSAPTPPQLPPPNPPRTVQNSIPYKWSPTTTVLTNQHLLSGGLVGRSALPVSSQPSSQKFGGPSSTYANCNQSVANSSAYMFANYAANISGSAAHSKSNLTSSHRSRPTHFVDGSFNGKRKLVKLCFLFNCFFL